MPGQRTNANSISELHDVLENGQESPDRRTVGIDAVKSPAEAGLSFLESVPEV